MLERLLEGDDRLDGRVESDAAAWGGERKEAFRQLAVSMLPRLYSVARKLVGDEAEDAVQDCLLKAFRSFGTLASDEAGPSWLMSVLMNACRDRVRARMRRPDEVDIDEIETFSLYRHLIDVDPFPYSDSLHVDFLQRFGPEDVHAVLLSLPELYRVPLVLVHMQGFSTKELARMLDVPLGTVLARLHRGRKLFEKRLWDYAEDHDLLREGALR